MEHYEQFSENYDQLIRALASCPQATQKVDFEKLVHDMSAAAARVRDNYNLDIGADLENQIDALEYSNRQIEDEIAKIEKECAE